MDLLTVVDSVKNLSPTPKILPKLQALLRDPESGIEDIIALIRMDGPLTAQIVRLSNSAAFAFTAPSTDLEGAVSCLGFQEVYKVVGVVATGQVLGRAVPVYQLESGELWENSIRTAVIMEAFAKQSKECVNTSYTLGLLHAMGKVVINSYYLDQGIEIYSDEDNDQIIPDLECQLIGFNHAQASAALLRKWAFPEESCTPIEFYPDPLSAPHYKNRACLIHIAAMAVKAMKKDPEAQRYDLNLQEEIIDYSGLDEFSLQDSLLEARDNLRNVEEFMSV